MMSDLSDLMQSTIAYMKRYVSFPSEHEPIACVLWVAHAWFIDAAETSPYLAVTSAEKRSGKTRLLEVLEQLVPRPWRAVSPTEAVLFRLAGERTLFFDEVDTTFGDKRQAELNEGIRAILNAGNRRGVSVPRMVGKGTKMEVQEFAVFGPKVLAGIGKLPDTVADRCIPIRLERRAKAQVVERFRVRDAENAAIPLREQFEAIPVNIVRQLEDARPDIPDALGDRAADSWEPLLAIADLAGGQWPALARGAAEGLNAEATQEVDEASAGVLLLANIRSVFDERNAERLRSADLVAQLVSDDDLAWATWRRGLPVTPHSVSRLLRAYGIRPGMHRFGDRIERGYLRADFEAAWSRYLPALPQLADRPETSTRQQPVSPAGDRGSSDEARVDELTVDRASRGRGQPGEGTWRHDASRA